LREKLAADPDSAAKLTAFKNMGDLAQAYLDASAQAGQRLTVPGADSAPADVQAFYERLGKPKEAAGYPFAKDSPEFAAAAYAANLTAGQADALHKASMAQLDDARAGMRATLAQDYQATDALLRTEYGERYDEAIAHMRKGLGNNPSTGALSPIAQSLVDAGLAGKPEIVRAFIELGRATSESTSPDGNTAKGQAQSVMNGRGFKY
jgi:tetratricopeptide (TPR) repeat protein